jgi:ribosomal protein S12 methylthiotransferase accessory factor
MCGGSVPPWGPRTQELQVAGAGWNAKQAELACVGEAIERCQPYRLPVDRTVEARYADWPLDEPAVDPRRWVLFHHEQYDQPGFPFARLEEKTVCHWVCCRTATTGDPFWVPEETAFLYPRVTHRFGPGLSTGLSCGRGDDPVLLRGLQEVIERDALVGAWWGSYPLEEWDAGQVFVQLGPVSEQLQRPNLLYRCYRVRSPFSAHVTIVTLTGEDREGFCFSTGSACRETRRASWLKSLLEAVQGRHYVRYLKARRTAALDVPSDFAQHAVYYSYHPQRLQSTVLERGVTSDLDVAGPAESLAELVQLLGPQRPVLFRNLTPPALASEFHDWRVLRVLVPGLQPLHGDHRLPQLGGQLWQRRGVTDWATMPPHPFA